MKSKFTIMRNNRHKMAEAKKRAHDRVRELVLQSIERQIKNPHPLDYYYSRPAFVWWNPKTWRL